MVWPVVAVGVVAARPSAVGGADVGRRQPVAGDGVAVAVGDATDDADTCSSWAVLDQRLPMHSDDIHMGCRQTDDGDDGGCRSCNAIFRCCSNPCCCSVRTVRRSKEGRVDSPKEC